MKNFHLTERFNARFSTDFFNIWNHANFANPAVTDVETIGVAGVLREDHLHGGNATPDSVLAAAGVLNRIV